MSSESTVFHWEHFVAGDTASFEPLFRGFYQGLYGYGIKLCRDSQLVEDAIQDLFEGLWRKRDHLAHITSPNVYLFVSLRRNLLRSLKKATQFDDLDHTDVEEWQISFNPEDLIVKKEINSQQKSELHRALNQLTNQQKEVLFLHYYNGMSYEEIEEILCINRQSVRNQMHRTMQVLRTVLNMDIMRLVISILLCLSFMITYLT
ncbi:MAG: sigma-70 family RNA polymerase sigma factor [Balneolaceae bacterium]